MAKLLLIDDDTEVLSVNKKYFMKEHYEVKTADSAEKGLKLLSTFEADCILLDIMMPGMDGFEACKRIRKISKAPIIILSGKTSEDDKINGLLLGADDYMIKPYSLRELSARIQVQIRRHAASEVASATVLAFPPLKIDIAMHKAYYDTEEILL
ncbi:MAG: response regulator transcription factor, partial [Agathobacter sp.]|nr:response regulator transcription factor [Agathobacter sp.]